jgi:translation initiation factor 5
VIAINPGVNPASLGASLTEGKRVKRSKNKQNGETNGDASPPRSDNDSRADIANDFDDDDDDDWAVDVSEAAVRARQQDLSDGVKSLAVTEDTEKPEKDRMDIFYKFLELKINGLKAGTCKLDDKEVLTEAERLDVRTKAALILAELLFDQNILAQVIDKLSQL